MKYYKNVNGDFFGFETSQELPDGMIEVSEAEIVAANHVPVTHVELRAAEFATIPFGNQLDMIYWDKVNGTTIWQDWVAGIKARNPK